MAPLRISPVPLLLRAGDVAVEYFTRRDLLAEPVGTVTELWGLPEVLRLRRGQHADGSWGAPGGYPSHHRPMFETFKRIRLLTGRYEMDRSHPAIRAGAEYLFSTQSPRGDFRGMLGDQYATYYTGEFTSLLVRAGYQDDPRIGKALEWLLSIRQDDGGWSIPILTRPGAGRRATLERTGQPAETIEPDRSRPFSHNWTDMVLRGFAAHPGWRGRPEVVHAARLLKSSFFEPDAYPSYRDAQYWVRFMFWWPNLLTALESLCEIGFDARDPDVTRALRWFRDHQRADGSWRITYVAGNKVNPRRERTEGCWVTLRIARLLHRLNSSGDPQGRCTPGEPVTRWGGAPPGNRPAPVRAAVVPRAGGTGTSALDTPGTIAEREGITSIRLPDSGQSHPSTNGRVVDGPT